MLKVYLGTSKTVGCFFVGGCFMILSVHFLSEEKTPKDDVLQYKQNQILQIREPINYSTFAA